MCLKTINLSNYIRRSAYKCDFPKQSQVFFIAESSVVVVTFYLRILFTDLLF